MSTSRDWHWQLEQERLGPDWLFTAVFAPGQGGPLAKRVREHLPPEYAPEPDSDAARPAGNCAVFARYLDRHTDVRLQAMRKSGRRENVYYYGEIQVCDHQLRIQNVLAGARYGETPLIIALADAPDLTLGEWSVSGGGDGYAWRTAAQGAGAGALRSYLAR